MNFPITINNKAELTEIALTIAGELRSLFNLPTPTPQPMSVSEQALQLLRQGKREESVALLKAHGKRRAA